jgi:hypothetical protein
VCDFILNFPLGLTHRIHSCRSCLSLGKSRRSQFAVLSSKRLPVVRVVVVCLRLVYALGRADVVNSRQAMSRRREALKVCHYLDTICRC